jgi:hypothetical protein
MRMSWSVRRVAVVASAAVIVASVVTLSAPGAGADTVSAALGARIGSGPYAGLDETHQNGYTSFLGKVVAPGKTAKFSLEVLNNGTTTSDFNLHLVSTPPGGSVRFLVGKTDVTSSVEAAAGYETPVLAPSKRFLVTAEMTAPATATADDFFDFCDVVLSSPDQLVQYGHTFDFIDVGMTTGSTDHDLFVKTAGQSSVRAAELNPGVSSKTIKPGQKATYVLTLKNDSTIDGVAVALIGKSFSGNCANFVPKAMLGKRDITAALLDASPGSEFAVDLDAGKSAKITLTVTVTGPLQPSCVDEGNFAIYNFTSEDNAGNPLSISLVTNSL